MLRATLALCLLMSVAVGQSEVVKKLITKAKAGDASAQGTHTGGSTAPGDGRGRYSEQAHSWLWGTLDGRKLGETK
jgi:hypothetical protein